MKSSASRPSALPALALYSMLLACVFGLVVLGGGLYSRLADSQTRNGELRAEVSYLYGRVRAADSAGGVAIGQGPEGPSLVLTDPAAPEYATRIYLYQGSLVEEYAEADSPLQPDQALAIAASDTFQPVLEGNLLTVETSRGRLQVALRALQGG